MWRQEKNTDCSKRRIEIWSRVDYFITAAVFLISKHSQAKLRNFTTTLLRQQFHRPRISKTYSKCEDTICSYQFQKFFRPYTKQNFCWFIYDKTKRWYEKYVPRFMSGIFPRRALLSNPASKYSVKNCWNMIQRKFKFGLLLGIYRLFKHVNDFYRIQRVSRNSKIATTM